MLNLLIKLNQRLQLFHAGINNKYGHPKEVTLSKLTKVGAQIYRTDTMGNITLISDGKTNHIICEK